MPRKAAADNGGRARQQTPYTIVAKTTVGKIVDETLTGDAPVGEPSVRNIEVWVPIRHLEAVSSRAAKTTFAKADDAVELAEGRPIAAIPMRAITWEGLNVTMVPKVEWGIPA